MARPNKTTLDYFQHDADASTKKTLRIMYNHFLHDGISLWWQLLENISSNKNLFIDLRENEIVEDLASKMHFTPDKMIQMIDKLASLEAIDQELWRQKVVWCQNLIDRHEALFTRWREGKPEKPGLAIKSELMSAERELMSAETIENSTLSTQSKVKKSKVKKSKVKKSTYNKVKRDIYGEFQNVQLSLDEYQKLLQRFGEIDAKNLIEQLSSGIASKGYEYKDHYATIINWSKRNGGKRGNYGGHEPESRRESRKESGEAWPGFKSITGDADLSV